ncbi:MAG TPA: hypothetical protein PK852_02525 [Mesotoga prima]|uniref:hypothetical protein n=1 Tax=Mesotoga prima TaxID=1184387 RepID=UPI002C269145|nr:hypothetical protein [Mesotoga prima]HPE52970.1 hypothetical protein [Mesotoga prima]
MKINNGPMWLVYVDRNGDNHYQPWTEVEEAGSLIDPATDEDMTLVGWTTDNPAWIVIQRKKGKK